jgi:superfamily II DNA or RNA helicase/diadenosine tetraphosphate (Ap4A) HIT family hydrolase/HKD family nuclease
MAESVFLEIPAVEHLCANDVAFAVFDGYPVTPGHALVIPRRVVSTWWEATPTERTGLLALVDEAKAILDERYAPDGYNVGFNAGAAAGQTVEHLHLHVIPRRTGDTADPAGGVRHVIPGKGNYLTPAPAPSSPVASSPALPGPPLPAAHLLDARDDRFLKLELFRCLRNDGFDRIDLLVSFIMKSGLRLITRHLAEALERGAVARVLTTDYLQVTDADALAELLDLSEASVGQSGPGRLDVKVFSDPLTSFHPKAYLFWASDGSVSRGFVGSSNLSASGIGGGVEWNLATAEVAHLVSAFDELWADDRSRSLDHALLRDYRRRWQPTAGIVATIGVETEPPAQPVSPRPIQQEALAALEGTRADGHAAGLVVLATGLGKTWLAAFDTTRPEFGRTLFVAHREEILTQSRDVFRQVRPDAELGLYLGAEKQPDADVVFASIQTLSRHLDAFAPDAFDYVVVDEFHHAAARSYRTVLDHFRPRFLLGLTATPDRTDGADLLALCGDNLVFQVDLVEGIEREELSPFRYWGVRDIADYAQIPWRNGRFDPGELARAVETQQRARQALDEWRDKTDGSSRTLAFCCSITHAEFMADFFRGAGVAAEAVHSGSGSASRHEALERLRAGETQVLCSVDVFNEGVDVPEVDAVLMLRPTESPVLFLQQLGRGLRRSEGKDALRVVDFVGNHRSFLLKPRALLGLTDGRTPTNDELRRALETGDFDLPDGCSVELELEAVELLAELLKKQAKQSALEEWCLSWVAEHGDRPTATQALRSGYNPAAARQRDGHWFGLMGRLGLLNAEEQAVVDRHGDVLAAITTEPTTKSYKLVSLRALLHDGTLRTGTTVEQVSATAHRLVSGDPRLVADVRTEENPDPAGAAPASWAAYWRRWPLTHLAKPKQSGASLFRLDGDRFEPTFVIEAELGTDFDDLVAEIVDWRLAAYLAKADVRAGAGSGAGVACRVIQTDGRPIVMLNGAERAALPEGEVRLWVDGEEHVGRFVKIALNVVTRPGSTENLLPDILHRWFGAAAGQRGTAHAVAFRRDGDRWSIAPIASATIDPLLAGGQ